jgi:hypothetical protein
MHTVAMPAKLSSFASTELSWLQYMTTILLRIVFGGILAAGVALWGQIQFPINIIFVLVVATMAGVWGDKFILGFMSLMRYLR